MMFVEQKPSVNKKKIDFFFIELKLRGVGFRSLTLDAKLFFRLGFSHYFCLPVPHEILILNKKDRIIFFSKHLHILTSFVTQVYRLRKPDVYKAKGVGYVLMPIITKVGKQRLFF